MMNADANRVIDHLGLQPLEIEGGWFREAYQASRTVQTAGGERPLATSIYYLLTPDTFSELHRLPGDEVFHFYLGDPVEMLHLLECGTVEQPVMGASLSNGQQVQVVVPGLTWQGARLRDGGRWALLGTTMSPGFSYEDYERGGRESLIAAFPTVSVEITALTRD